jgi:hypothetical protein
MESLTFDISKHNGMQKIPSLRLAQKVQNPLTASDHHTTANVVTAQTYS